MTTKKKLSTYLYIIHGGKNRAATFLTTVAVTLFMSVFISAPSFAVPCCGGGNPPPPPPPSSAKCAILDQGRVQCPSGVKAGKCYYKDLGDPNPKGSIDGFVEAPSCTNGIFQAAECPPSTTAGGCQVTASEDPALTACKSAGSCDLVKKYVDPLINVLAAAVGVVVTISIVVAGIQYSSAGGDPGKVQAARKRIMNSIIALVGFFLFYAVLQWLIPGGLLNG